MKNVKQTLTFKGLQIEGSPDGDIYTVEQGEDGKFYATSVNGYNGYDGIGFKTMQACIKSVEKQIKNYFVDRCIEKIN